MSTHRELIRRALGPRVQFVQGDDACAYGAVLAGCTFFAGYPITPATEVAERMAEILPRIGGCYIQMEDEIASMGALVGASWTGAKVMTSTSGPGFSLMQENLLRHHDRDALRGGQCAAIRAIHRAADDGGLR